LNYVSLKAGDGHAGVKMRALIALVLALSAAAAQAQEFKKIDGLLPNRAEFDVPDGYFQHWDADVGCKANALRMLVTFRRFGKPTTTWKPAVAVIFQYGNDETRQDIVKFSLVAVSFAPPFRASLAIVRATPQHPEGEYLQNENYAASFDGDGAIPISITWSADGDVAAVFDGEEHMISLHGPIDHIKIVGSSGAGVLEPLEIGAIGDPSAATSCKPVARAGGLAPPRG
jgi:hypothetical protein